MGEPGTSQELTPRQIEARARLRQRAAEYRDQAQLEAASFEGRPTTKDLIADDAAEQGDSLLHTVKPSARDRSLDPEGPPWHYDITPDERAEKAQKRKERDKKKQKFKDKASEKTPKKLKNPSGLQVRFRTGLVYTLITFVCIILGDIPMVLMLMVTAGICAGEFYYMLRADAKLPNEILGIIAAVLYPPSVYFGGAAGVVALSLVFIL